MSKLGIVSLVIILASLLLAVNALPPFGAHEFEVGQYYLDHGAEETDSCNIVSSIVWVYRGYDTLGESTVLFVAMLGVILVLRREMQ